MGKYVVLHPISYDGTTYPPGQVVEMAADRGEAAMKCGLVTDQLPQVDPPPILTVYRVLSPVSHDGRLVEPGGIVSLPDDRAEPLLAQGIIELEPRTLKPSRRKEA